MPWLLQPKSYTQIARPNLYNVAYRRVGTYKGMGRLHPTNYLQIGYRPNMIGASTGQYNTLSGQLSLLPPSLRGLGQGTINIDPASLPTVGISDNPLYNLPLTGPLATAYGSTYGQAALQPGAAALVPSAYLQALPGGGTPSGGGTPTLPGVGQIPNWLLFAFGGILLIALMGGRR